MQRIRSALYVPADNVRAMFKAPTLACDALIYDLEDGVAPEKKAEVRRAIAEALTNKNSHHFRVVRVNHHFSAFFTEDMAMICDLPVDALMLSKVSDVADITMALAAHGRADLPIWCNIETPRGMVNVDHIGAHPCVSALVAGTNDLTNDLHITRTTDRLGLLHALSRLVLAARAYGCLALDGTFVDLEDEEGLKLEAQQGRALGFDRKTLFHPSQIDVVNQAFSPSEEEIAAAQNIITAYEIAQKEHKAVIVVDGKMIEALHYRRAKEVLELAEMNLSERLASI